MVCDSVESRFRGLTLCRSPFPAFMIYVYTVVHRHPATTPPGNPFIRIVVRRNNYTVSCCLSICIYLFNCFVTVCVDVAGHVTLQVVLLAEHILTFQALKK